MNNFSLLVNQLYSRFDIYYVCICIYSKKSLFSHQKSTKYEPSPLAIQNIGPICHLAKCKTYETSPLISPQFSPKSPKPYNYKGHLLPTPPPSRQSATSRAHTLRLRLGALRARAEPRFFGSACPPGSGALKISPRNASRSSAFGAATSSQQKRSVARSPRLYPLAFSSCRPFSGRPLEACLIPPADNLQDKSTATLP